MDSAKSGVPKLPDMVMCGDHPSFTKTELNVKEPKPDEKEKEKEKKSSMSYPKITPTTSRTDRPERTDRETSQRLRATSDHTLRLIEARRRVRSLEVVQRADIDVTAPGNRALVQAALGSFRWPPYLLAVWVVVLVLTHILHCLVTVLERSLPNIKKFCQYFKAWTEDTWKTEIDINRRVYPIALALVTGAFYSVYYALWVLYSVSLWSIEPLCSDLDGRPSAMDVEAKVTNYVDEVSSKSNASVKR